MQELQKHVLLFLKRETECPYKNVDDHDWVYPYAVIAEIFVLSQKERNNLHKKEKEGRDAFKR